MADDRELAVGLFHLVNLIAEEAITMPKRIDEMYSKMPQAKVAEIARKDGPPGVAQDEHPDA